MTEITKTGGGQSNEEQETIEVPVGVVEALVIDLKRWAHEDNEKVGRGTPTENRIHAGRCSGLRTAATEVEDRLLPDGVDAHLMPDHLED